MNPLTIVKRIQNLNKKEASLSITEEASWHAKYKDSAYVFVGGIPFDLTEGDLLAVFAQYGEIVDVNLVRDKGTGKSKGFAFVAYEDQRSTILAVDNLNGAQVLGRIMRVDHVENYKKKEEEDDETMFTVNVPNPYTQWITRDAKLLACLNSTITIELLNQNTV